MTLEEQVLWRELRKRQLGVTFRRQCPVLGYVVDFFASDCALAVEVDGLVHAKRERRDTERDARLASAGIIVLRFTNAAVIDDLPSVVARISASVTTRHLAGSERRTPHRID